MESTRANERAASLAKAFREAAEGDSGDAELRAAVDMAEFLEELSEYVDVLANAASSWATELTNYVIPFHHAQMDEENAKPYEDERDAVQAALGKYLGADQ